MSFKGSGVVSTSPESARMLRDLMAANGVNMQPSTPWYVELNYDEFDNDGDNVHSGTIEEFYLDQDKYRRVIKTDEFSQTEVATGSELYRAGDQGWPPQATLQAIREVLSPVYVETAATDSSPDKIGMDRG